ncbi:hypothetical protein [Clostridium baratii]|uniref:hypothetical protein n=1 Tax=Clostridium baratii TaxID=1561 RepID=UPI002901264A|nr:hypothetical protein [Clostridium baratii]MDU1053458.1 hypothetical protein [Clostridium baratii]
MISEKKINLLINNMKFWRLGKDIYPNNIRALLNIDYITTYNILDFIKDMGILEYRFEIYCTKCNKYLDKKQLKSLNEFPKNIYCDEDHKLNPVDNTILIYKVIINE